MRLGKCPKCGGTEIIVAHPGEYGDGSQEVGPMSVTAEPRWVMSGRNPSYGKGELVLYVCRTCGFAEWYAEDPQSIPIGEEYKTELLGSSEPDADADEPDADTDE